MKGDQESYPSSRVTELLLRIQSQPDDAELYQELGRAYRENGQPEEAYEAFKKALDLAPDPWNWMYLGNIHYIRAEYERALTAFEHACTLEPANAAAYFFMADAYHGLGLHRKADAYYRKAVEVEPDDEVATDNLRRWESIVERGAYHERKT